MKAIGIALGEGRLVAALPGGRLLEAADIADLKVRTGLPRARLSVALLPPLVDVRRVSLPPLRDAERRRVLARDAARYFLGARGPQVIGTDGDLAAAAPAALVAELEAAVAAAGWSLGVVVPAHVAWVGAGTASNGWVIARLPDATELLRADRGRLVERRRLRPGDAVSQAVEVDPYPVAAAGAARARALELYSDDRHEARRRAAGRLARALAVGAAACLLLTAGLDYWGLGRELAAVRARRAAIAPQVAAAMRARDSLDAVAGVVETLGALESTSPRWSAFFADLADYLPRDAHLVALRTVGDSVAAVGIAREAAAVFEGLERMPHLTAVRSDGPIRQEVAPSGTVREHFGLSARWGATP